MEHADPWDENARLERQMDAELMPRPRRTVVEEAEAHRTREQVAPGRTREDRAP